MHRLQIYKGFFWLLCLFIVYSPAAFAGHITGGEIFYEYYGRVGENHSYRVTLRLLMRCNSPRDFPSEVIIGVFDRNDHQRVRDVRTPLTSRSQLNRPSNDPCISNPPELCFEVAEYSTVIELAERKNGYLLAAQIVLRVSGIANVEGPSGNMGATYTAEIPGWADGLDAPVNHSARFNGNDLVIMCSENIFEYNFAARDANNDTLRYRFCGAYQTANFFGDINNAAPPDSPPYPPIPYAFNYSGTMPFGSRVSLNNKNGIASGNAPGSGIYLISICVDEIRGGKVIATQRKDIQVSIAGCNKAAALLEPEYNLCGESNTVFMVNLSRSPLIQTYEWNLYDQKDARISRGMEPRFSHVFVDTGLYKVILHTNKGLQCSDSTTTIVRYYPGFKADFNFTGLCLGGTTRFFDQSKFLYGRISNHFWVLDEPAAPGNQSYLPNPNFRYETKGTRSVFLRIENENGCRDSIFRPVAIIENPPASLAFRDTLICRGDTLKLQAFGPGTFSWSGAGGFVSETEQPDLLVAPLLTTAYRVVQINDNCRSEDSVRVRVVDQVTLSVNADTTICNGDSLLLYAKGNGLLFDWYPRETLAHTDAQFTMARPLSGTMYSVRATVGGCSAVDSFWVRTVPYPVANAGNDKTICKGDTIMIGEHNIASNFRWFTNDPGFQLIQANPMVSPTQTTTYVLEVFEDSGCPKPGRDSITVVVQLPIVLSVVKDTSVVVNQPLQLFASGAQYYRWIPAANLSDAFIANPKAIFRNPIDEMIYTLIGTNDGGCLDTAFVRVRVFAKSPSIYVPTAFTPNGDGLNETLKPTLAGIQRLEFFRVFNRYGQIVFQSSSPNEAWDGQQKGQPQPPGNYLWMAQAIDYEGKILQVKGSTLLIR